MQPTTLLLPDPLRRRLREVAARRGVSVAEVIRAALVRELGPQTPAPKAGHRARRRLPASVFDYLAEPAGIFAGCGCAGASAASEDPYADVD